MNELNEIMAEYAEDFAECLNDVENPFSVEGIIALEKQMMEMETIDLSELTEEQQAAFNSWTTCAAAFLGETIRMELGGQWEYKSDGMPICLVARGESVNVFDKIGRRLSEGPDNNLVAFYKVIVQLLKNEKNHS